MAGDYLGTNSVLVPKLAPSRRPICLFSGVYFGWDIFVLGAWVIKGTRDPQD